MAGSEVMSAKRFWLGIIGYLLLSNLLSTINVINLPSKELSFWHFPNEFEFVYIYGALKAALFFAFLIFMKTPKSIWFLFIFLAVIMRLNETPYDFVLIAAMMGRRWMTKTEQT